MKQSPPRDLHLLLSLQVEDAGGAAVMLGIGALVLMVASLQHLHLAFLLHQPIHSAPFGMFSPFL